MKLAILAILLTGCSISPAAQKALAERSVDMTAWGVYCVGVEFCGVGYLQYRRNPQVFDKIKPAEIVVP